MKVRVKLFAAARELAGVDQLEVQVPDRATITDLRLAVAKEFPALQKIVRHSVWAVDAEYAADGCVINEHSEVALIPPVSGG
jgi:molybdopterin converting factor subunit 1